MATSRTRAARATTSWREDDADDSRTYATYSNGGGGAHSDDDDDDDDASVWTSAAHVSPRPTPMPVHVSPRPATTVSSSSVRTLAAGPPVTPAAVPVHAASPPPSAVLAAATTYPDVGAPAHVGSVRSRAIDKRPRDADDEVFTIPAPPALGGATPSILERAPPDAVVAAALPPWATPLSAEDARASVAYARAELADERAADADPIVRAATLVAGYARMQLSAMLEREHPAHNGTSTTTTSYGGGGTPAAGVSPALAAYLGTTPTTPTSVDDAVRHGALLDAHRALRASRVTGQYRPTPLFETHTRAAWRIVRSAYPATLGSVPLRTLLVSDEFVDAFALLAASSIGASDVRARRRASDERVYANRKRAALAEFAHARYVPAARSERARLVYELPGGSGSYGLGPVSPEAAYGAALERVDPRAAARAQLAAALGTLPGYASVVPRARGSVSFP
jgi:hypothetical protein